MRVQPWAGVWAAGALAGLTQDLIWYRIRIFLPEVKPSRHKKVGVVVAGEAGLSDHLFVGYFALLPFGNFLRQRIFLSQISQFHRRFFVYFFTTSTP